MRAWNRLTAAVVRHRGAALALSCVATAACALAAPGIPFRSGVAEYLPDDVPEVHFWLDLSRRFDAFSTLLVGLEEPEAPMTREGLTRLSAVTRDLSELEAGGALAVRSIANVDSLHEGDDGAIDTERLVPAVPSDPAGLEALRRRVQADQEVLGALVSRDLRGYAVLVRVDPRKDPAAVARLVQQVVERDRGPLRAYYFGAPFFSAVVHRHVYARVGWIAAAFALLLLAVLLLLGVRRPAVIALVLAGAALSLVWWLGALRLLGLGLSQTSLNAALVLLAIAVVAFAGGAEARLRGEATAAFPPTLAAALAAVGLSCFVVAKVAIAYLALFGATMAAGVLAIWLFALLAFVPAASFVPAGLPAPSSPRPLLSPSAGAAAALAIVLAGIGAAARARFLVAPGEMFSARDEVGEALAFFDRRFGGTDFIQVSFKGDLRDPPVAARLLRLTDLLEGSRAFSDVRSVAQILAFLGHGFDGTYGIPTSRESLANLWFFLEGSQDVRNLVSDRRDEAMVTLRVPPSTPADTRRQIDAVNGAVAASAEVGAAAARRRLRALADVAGLGASDAAIDALVARASAPPDEAERQAIEAEALSRLRGWLASPDSPYPPSDEEWALLSRAFSGAKDDLRARLGAAASSMGGLPAGRRGPFVDTAIGRWKELRLDARSAGLAASLAGESRLPEESRARLCGAVADLLAPQASGGTAAVTVSGFPVVAGAIEVDLEKGLWAALLALLGTGALLLFAFTRRWTTAARRLLEAAAATALTLVAARLLSVPIDSGSATIYLLPALLALLAPAAGEGRGGLSLAFLLALAAAGLSLLFTGALPVTRVGATTSIALAAVAAVSWLSGRVGPAARPS